RNPCNLPSRRPDIGDSAVAGERPKNLWAAEPARECVSSPAVPSNPNSRLGRGRSPFAQGWDRMDAMVVGIDVSKDRLDVAVRPTGESFAFKRTAAGIDDLVARRRQIVDMIAAEGQRAGRMSNHRLTRSIGRLRKALEKELDELDRLIDDHMRGSAVWVETEKLLVSVPGVGKTIARTLIA